MLELVDVKCEKTSTRWDELTLLLVNHSSVDSEPSAPCGNIEMLPE